MIPRATRNLRAGLLVLLFLVATAVVWSVWLRPGPPPAPPRIAGASGSGTTSTGLVLRSFRAGDERFVIKARTSEGQEKEGLRLHGVEVTFPYVDKGKPASATITADECLCEPEPRRAAFRGHVRVTTEDGLELLTESLDYRGEDGLAESAEEVRFKRGRVSGSGKGMRYDAEGQTLELRADVRLHIEEEGKPATDIQAGRARAQRSDDTMHFEGGVVVRKGSDWLEAAALSLGFLGDFAVMTRAVARDDVRVLTSDALVVPNAKRVAGGGGRRLACRKLDIVFRPTGPLEAAVASGGHDESGAPLYAELELIPSRKGPPERRRLQARVIVFRFDDQGRLAALQGQLGTIASAEPKGPEPNGPRGPVAKEARAENLVARVDPASGDLQGVDFDGGVTFAQGRQTASAAKARYDAGRETLYLTGDARVTDEEQGTNLRADAIDLGTRKEVVAARGSVRHTMAARRSPAPGGLLSGDEPAVFLARNFDYDGATRIAHYRDDALLRSGKDEVRAPLLVVEEPAAGQRRLTGTGGVASILHPRASPSAKKAPEAVDARSQEMVYDEAKSRVTYTGDVAIRQGDIRTKSPEAVVTLSGDGKTVESMVAGEPVEVVQGARKATGTKGTYTPSEERFVLVGEKVELVDPERRIEGRILTFQVGDDRIRVDGQEETRTEAVFKRDSTKPPPPKPAPAPPRSDAPPKSDSSKP
jgi:LPS export ABC transporter protein LptC/lipopolysaccharide transport protein LptA